jgi:hypothetical protein
MILRYEMSTAAKKRNGGALGTRHAIRVSARGTGALVAERPANLRGPRIRSAPEKKRDVSCWPDPEAPAAGKSWCPSVPAVLARSPKMNA